MGGLEKAVKMGNSTFSPTLFQAYTIYCSLFTRQFSDIRNINKNHFFIYSHSCLPLMNSHALTKPTHHLTPACLPLLPLSVLVTLQTPPNYLIFSPQPSSLDIQHSIPGTKQQNIKEIKLNK